MEPILISLLGGIAGGFLTWSLKGVITPFLVRRRLLIVLNLSLKNHLRTLRDNGSWLKTVEGKTLVSGAIVKTAADYTNESIDYFAENRELILHHLTRREIELILKACGATQEVEILFEGFCRDLMELKKSEAPLSREIVDHLHSKAARIRSYLDIFPQELKKITDLPGDFRGILLPESLVVRSDEPAAQKSGGNGEEDVP